MTDSTKHVLLVLGSARDNPNATGLSEFLMNRWKKIITDRSTSSITTEWKLSLAQDLMPSGIPLPIGPVTDTIITAFRTHSEDYSTHQIRCWSHVVKSSVGVIILTPQFNWGYPGNLKNLLDQLYHEWNSKPFLLFTYGGHGGTKCSEQLSTVLQGGLKANIVSKPVGIVLPTEYIRQDKRVAILDQDQIPSFLKESIEDVDRCLSDLLDHLQQQQQQQQQQNEALN